MAIVLFMALCKVEAQQPAYFILGEDQFKGIQIYDIIQDNDLNYLFATNEGIYYYDYHNYSKIECDEAKSSSVFNFIMNEEGTIYCHNLNNQIFKINGKECEVFYELTKEESRADISLAIAEDGNLIVGARHILVIGKDKKIISRIELKARSAGAAYTTPKNEIQFHLANSDTIITYFKGKLGYKRLSFINENLSGERLLKFFRFDVMAFAYDLKSKRVFEYEPTTYTLKRITHRLSNIEGAVRIYETNDGFWAASTLPGVQIFRDKLQPVQLPYYSNYFISTVCKDNEGNTLLGTFDKGVIVIPDLDLPDVIQLFPDDPIISIHPDLQNGLYLGTSKGKFANYKDGKIDIIVNEGKHPVEGIYGSNNTDWLFFDNGGIHAHHKNTGKLVELSTSSLKDASVVSDELTYLGTNNGVIIKTNNSIYTHPELKQRIYSIEYDEINKNVYTSTAEGLFVLFPDSKTKRITYNNADIFPNDLHYSNGKIYANTRKSGILIIENSSVTGSIQPIVNGEPENLKKLIVYENSIIGNSINGLFRFDMSGKLMYSLHSIYRINSKRIVDFAMGKDALDQDVLWVCHSGGIQLLALKNLENNISAPLIRFDAIKVNERLVGSDTKGNFKNNERTIQFVFSSPTLKDRENISYHYKLDGYDKDFKIQPYNKNEVTYNALAPGTYTFQIKAENQGKFSPVVEYTFTIAKPVYANWWFILIIVILFLAIVYFIYRYQLNKINRRNRRKNELISSRLTALKSQMNPHFIFNSLNSIQDLVLQQQTEKSYDYLVKFSDLVRQTLNFSDKEFIDFEDEIKLLKVYLELEQLRFQNQLKYTLDTKEVEEIEIPPMLIQPFVENALKHGLLHKQGEKILSIVFEQKEVLICTITDNGIGREKAREIKERQKRQHESFSVKATRNRFEIMQELYKSDLGVEYEDLYENDEPAGTKVIIRLPFKQKY